MVVRWAIRWAIPLLVVWFAAFGYFYVEVVMPRKAAMLQQKHGDCLPART